MCFGSHNVCALVFTIFLPPAIRNERQGISFLLRLLLESTNIYLHSKNSWQNSPIYTAQNQKTHGTAEFSCNTLIISLLQISLFTDGTTGGTTEFLCNILLFNTLQNRFSEDGTTGRKNPKYGGTAEFPCNCL